MGSWSTCSVRSLSSAQACTKAGCPSGEPRTTTPRWALGLSPRHTSSPSSALPGGAKPASAAMPWVLHWTRCRVTPLFYRAHRGVEGGSSPGRRRDHVKVVQESDEAVVGMECFRHLLKGIVQSEGEKRGGEGVPCTIHSTGWKPEIVVITGPNSPSRSNHTHLQRHGDLGPHFVPPLKFEFEARIWRLNSARSS